MDLYEKARRKREKQMAREYARLQVAQLDREDEATIRAWRGAQSALVRGNRRPVNKQAAKDISH